MITIYNCYPFDPRHTYPGSIDMLKNVKRLLDFDEIFISNKDFSNVHVIYRSLFLMYKDP